MAPLHEPRMIKFACMNIRDLVYSPLWLIGITKAVVEIAALLMDMYRATILTMELVISLEQSAAVKITLSK